MGAGPTGPRPAAALTDGWQGASDSAAEFLPWFSPGRWPSFRAGHTVAKGDYNGISPAFLFDPMSTFAGGFVLAEVSVVATAGVTASGLLAGFGQGYDLGFASGYDIGAEIVAGLSIPLPAGSWEVADPTPETS
jgi:hypothetical protein